MKGENGNVLVLTLFFVLCVDTMLFFHAYRTERNMNFHYEHSTHSSLSYC